MDFKRDESAKWSQAVQKATDELETQVQAALDKNAARGFVAPIGPTLAAVLAMGNKVQVSLTEENSKIYGEIRERIFKIESFDLNMAVEVNKLALAWYKAEILNALTIEQAEQEAQIERWRADIIRVNAETDQRGVTLIRAKADLEHQINELKAQQIKAEYQALGAEIELVNAKIATAEEKLKTIDSLWEVIAAEKLVIVAEKKRAASLELVAASKKRLAAIQTEMIPYYYQKAEARKELAAATVEETKYREASEKLGYRHLELKNQEQAAEHSIRLAEYDNEYAQEALTKATGLAEYMRWESRALIRAHQTEVERALFARENDLKARGLDLNLGVEYKRRKMSSDAEVAVTDYHKKVLAAEIAAKLADLETIGKSDSATTTASASQKFTGSAVTTMTEIIHKGSYM